MKNILNLLILLTLFLCTTVFLTVSVKAGDNIPSAKEVVYAQNFYSLMKNFDQKEDQFLAQTKTIKRGDNLKLKQVFNNKFNYTKKYYLDVRALQPTTKFGNFHQAISEGIYANLQYIQKIIQGLEAGKDFEKMNKELSASLKESNLKYKNATATFNSMVNTWKQDYINKVTGKTATSTE